MSNICSELLDLVYNGTKRDKKIFTQEAQKVNRLDLKNAFYIIDKDKVKFKKIVGNEFAMLERKMNPRPMADNSMDISIENIENYNFSKWKRGRQTSILVAINKGLINQAIKLIETGEIYLETPNDCKETPLMIAVSKNMIKVVEALINIGKINMNHKNNAGYTSLMIAADRNYPYMVKLLIDSDRINIKAKDDFGNTALMIAVKHSRENLHTLQNNIKTFDLILNSGKSNPTAQTTIGTTALIYSVEYRNSYMVNSLIKTGNANIFAKGYVKYQGHGRRLYTAYDLNETIGPNPPKQLILSIFDNNKIKELRKNYRDIYTDIKSSLKQGMLIQIRKNRKYFPKPLKFTNWMSLCDLSIDDGLEKLQEYAVKISKDITNKTKREICT